MATGWVGGGGWAVLRPSWARLCEHVYERGLVGVCGDCVWVRVIGVDLVCNKLRGAGLHIHCVGNLYEHICSIHVFEKFFGYTIPFSSHKRSLFSGSPLCVLIC